MSENLNNTICAFTGHRSYDGSAEELLRATIATLYSEGVRTFRVGMAEGFDLAAGEAVVALKSEFSDVVFEAIVPFADFSKRFGLRDKALYDSLLSSADAVRYAAVDYRPNVFHCRNDMLIEGAATVIAWYDGSKGGTAYTINKAQRQGSRIINLRPSEQLSLDF